MNDVTFAKALSSVMLDNKYDRFVKNRRTGKLDTKSLYKINTSPRLFKRREARKNKDYAISLVVDCSGSMEGFKIEMAAESARKISYHLSKMDIPHNILIFHGTVEELKPMNSKYDEKINLRILGETGEGVMRSDLYRTMFWYRDEKVVSFKGNSMCKYMACTQGSEKTNLFRQELYKKGIGFRDASNIQFNTDAEALKIAREKILKQKGKKLIIHLSDGKPAPAEKFLESPHHPGFSQSDFYLKKEVALTLASGVELYSIGIQSDEVNKFYPAKRTCSINELDQLYPHIIKLIRLNLRRG